jgi:hypothetical protein
MLMPSLATVIPTALFVLILMLLVINPRKGPGGEAGTHLEKKSATGQPPAATASKISIPEAELTQNKKEPDKAATRTKGSTPSSVKKRTVKKSSGRKKTVATSSRKKASSDPLTVLESLVERGNLNTALKRFAEQKINDGSYYALYARCYYESGEWKKAFEMARKSVQVPSTRISMGHRKGQYLLYKAKFHSVQYDASQSRSAAQKAIESWWEVREHFDGTAEDAKASFAESEINRLSTAMNR